MQSVYTDFKIRLLLENTHLYTMSQKKKGTEIRINFSKLNQNLQSIV